MFNLLYTKLVVASLYLSPFVLVDTSFLYNDIKLDTYQMNNILSNKDFDTFWLKEIKEKANNDNIQLFFTRDVTLVYQQSLIATNYMLLKEDVNKEIVWIANEKDVQNKKWNYNFYIPTNNRNNFKLITNSNFMNENIRGTAYSNFIDNSLIISLNNYFDSINKKVDLWIPDINIERIWNNNNSFDFYKFIKRINKINILSDGNYQQNFFAINFVNYINKKGFKQLGINESNESFKNILNDDENVYFDKFKSTSIFDYVLADKYISVFNVESYSNSPYFELDDDKIFYNVYSYNYDYIQMGKKLFENDFNSMNEYTNLYESFFNLSNINSFNDFILKNGEIYDPKKKNIIYIGDALISSESDKYPERQQELNNITKAMLKKYNPNQYNWIIKNHPRYSLEDQENLNQYIFPDNFKPIFLKSFPWEIFLSWDNKKSGESSGYKPFFNNSYNYDNGWNTKLVGIQYLSTVIETTYFYLIYNHNMGSNYAYQSVSAIDFPVPATFDVERSSKYYNFSPYSNLKDNIYKINKSHEPFYRLNKFSYYKNDLISSKDYINGVGIIYDYPLKDNTTTTVTIVILLIMIIVCLILIVLIVIKKKKKGKKYEK